MTVQEADRYIFDQLKTIYEEGEAQNISSWVIEHITGSKKTDRIVHREKQISAEQQATLQSITQRLLQHEPIQYILNESWFCGLKLYVDKSVLIPRPETEELVDWIITDCKFPINTLSILDIGSGSGCIPIALKKRLSKADVSGIDVSSGALKVARQNAATLGIGVQFHELDFLDAQQREPLPSFDIIVSNPPYIPVKDKATMHHNVLLYEPAVALFVPDNDALVFYNAIAAFGKTHLNKKGMIYAEIHESMGEATKLLFEEHGYEAVTRTDMQGKERMIKAFVT